jgi:metal-responsive CopG/Arc/MetJ family transcriptional regulator
MKTAISIPPEVFEEAESFAHRRRLSRSALYTRAVEEFLARHRSESVTEQLNLVYGKQSSALDPVITKLRDLALPDDSW